MATLAQIKQQVVAVVKEASIIDEAPTIMKIFGLDMDGVDGRPLDELLEVK